MYAGLLDMLEITSSRWDGVKGDRITSGLGWLGHWSDKLLELVWVLATGKAPGATAIEYGVERRALKVNTVNPVS